MRHILINFESKTSNLHWWKERECKGRQVGSSARISDYSHNVFDIFSYCIRAFTHVGHTRRVNHVHFRPLPLVVGAEDDAASERTDSTVERVSVNVHGHSLVQVFQRDGLFVLRSVVSSFCSGNIGELSGVGNQTADSLKQKSIMNFQNSNRNVLCNI